MRTEKMKLNEILGSELNEREMCRVLGGGEVGCCQCGCNYEGTPGGSSTSANNSANNARGLTSDGSQPCCSTGGGNDTFKKEFEKDFKNPQDNLCIPRPLIP